MKLSETLMIIVIVQPQRVQRTQRNKRKLGIVLEYPFKYVILTTKFVSHHENISTSINPSHE